MINAQFDVLDAACDTAEFDSPPWDFSDDTSVTVNFTFQN
jgi:hypothetical protein